MEIVSYYNETEDQFIEKLKNLAGTFLKNLKEGHIELSCIEYKRFKKLVRANRIIGAKLNIFAWPTVMGISIIKESRHMHMPF